MNIWNSLPNWVVDVQSVDLFKVQLDRFWVQQEVMYDWTAELAGTGDRSEYVEKNDSVSYTHLTLPTKRIV